MEGPSLILESAAGGETKARLSLVAWEPEVDVIVKEGEDVREALRELRGGDADTGTLYKGGPIGYVSYEAVEAWEGVKHKGANDMGWPWGEFVVPKKFVVYDHVLGHASLCGVNKDELGVGEPSELKVFDERLDVPKDVFVKWVEEVRRLEEEGEAIQVVISKSYTYRYEGDLRRLYFELRRINPSPYMFHLRMKSGEVLGSSPELLFRVERGRAETFPIAGTRPRGKDEWEDLRLEEDLKSDPKERAEHLMLVDLARNDLGKVSRPGTVRVTNMMYVEKYSHVQHLVSKVESELDPLFGPEDVLAATFPAGTVSGAPKPAAMEIIGNLETLRRGPYAGAVGFVSGGEAEFAITIRSFFARSGLLRAQAGAGIVYYSVPLKEWEETEHKLAALKRALAPFLL
ncbi:anthranilate synthase, component I [Ignicoccus hospitalis KIN4/I]|uniref:anthranilate synthase n=1 Tax=Ignicoccus hospitalis (strain KIN4/I / DSM 18386 / JCM 14125) TaxID=453591 RepID=A8AB03_IGNH4|nr:anthranilate synthase, component I [Ignicoccus hospitalis KIN4/I]